VDLMGLKPNP